MYFDIDAHAAMMDKKADMLEKRLAELEAAMGIATNNNETSCRKKDNVTFRKKDNVTFVNFKENPE